MLTRGLAFVSFLAQAKLDQCCTALHSIEQHCQRTQVATRPWWWQLAARSALPVLPLSFQDKIADLHNTCDMCVVTSLSQICQVTSSSFCAKAAVSRTTSSSEFETGAKRSGRPAQTCSKSS